MPLTTDVLTQLGAALADRYTLERELGHGAMATVYLARDLKHGRYVAVKVLSPELTTSVAAERFLHEIQTTARLMHPHILTLIDSGEVNGLLYYIMPHVEGESLGDRLRREGRLPLKDAIRIAIQVADALAYAHAQGIIHRDIKPANILLPGSHNACVADFGLARALHTAASHDLTATGHSVGSPMYMSPEQASGENALDGRSDIYSLGCVLYEMLAGKPPFKGKSVQGLLVGHMTEPPPRIRAERRDVSETVERAILKAMAKAPRDRYAGAEEFARVLDPAGLTRRRGHLKALARQWRRSAYVAAAIGIPLFILVGHLLSRGKLTAATSPSAVDAALTSIAVLPFVNIGADPAQEYFSDGMTEELIRMLDRVSGLRVTSPTSAFAFKGKRPNVSEIRRKLGVAWVLNGSVRRLNDSVFVEARLADARTGSIAWEDKYAGEMRDVFSMQQRIARGIGVELKVTALPIGPPTTNVPAYNAYIKGVYAWRERTAWSFQKALGFFNEAISYDPRYALAYAGIAHVHNLRGAFDFGFEEPKNAYPLAKAAADSALLLDSSLAEAYAARGLYQFNYKWDVQAAQQDLEHAIVLMSGYASAHQWLALCLAVRNQPVQAIASAQRARDLDPFSLAAITGLARVYYFARDYKESIAHYRMALDMEPGFAEAYLGLGMAYMAADSPDAAITQYSKALKEAPPAPPLPPALGLLAHAYGIIGEREKADRLIKQLEEIASSRYVPAEYLAVAYLGIGDVEAAIRHLETAQRNRSGVIVYLGVEPILDSIKDNPRFIKLLTETRQRI